MTAIAAVMFVVSILATFAFLLLSRRHLRPGRLTEYGVERPKFVFVLPCLNEEFVIGASLERLLAIEGGDVAILVIDDGSDDATGDIVRSYQDEHPNVWLLQRTRPNARLGKGAALNHAYQHLRDSDLLAGHDPYDVVLAVVDADGRVAPDVLDHVAPPFADPAVGAVQIGVRMTNADTALLPRLQDMEFVVFLDIFQRGRNHLGSVGLGGNGQFARLAALQTLGEEPWSDCLTEDLDLGIRLIMEAWKNVFCHTTHVAQQGLVDVRRLVRQRTRWFQGHLQCWRLLPAILRSRLPNRTVIDLSVNLLGPVLVLATSVVSAVFVVALVFALVTNPGAVFAVASVDSGLLLLAAYLLTYGLAPVYAWIYRLHTPNVGRLQALGLGHIYCVYGYIWYLAGWKAVARLVTRKSGWVKTQRVADAGSRQYSAVLQGGGQGGPTQTESAISPRIQAQ